jgi:hypothetical protein
MSMKKGRCVREVPQVSFWAGLCQEAILRFSVDRMVHPCPGLRAKKEACISGDTY